MTTDDERIAYLAGDGPGALGPPRTQRAGRAKGDPLGPCRCGQSHRPARRRRGRRDRRRAGPLRVSDRDRRATSTKRASWQRHRPSAPSRPPLAILVATGGRLAQTMASPSETLAAALEPTDLVPDARGQATFTRTDSGWRIELRRDRASSTRRGSLLPGMAQGGDASSSPIGSFDEGEGRPM